MRPSSFATSYRTALAALAFLPGAVALTIASPALAQAQATGSHIGRVVSATGTVMIERPGQRPALAGDGAEVHPGDFIETVGDSGARIRYRDNSELRLRPGTRMAVTDFRIDPANPREERFTTQLVKGGLRAISGLIARRTPANVEFRTTTATVGIRGTDFVMRVCGQSDCVAERVPVAQTAAPPAARVARARGTLTAVNANGERRALGEGAAVYAGDVLRAGDDADATLVFRDDARIALKAGSVLGVERYAYQAAQPRNDSTVLRLFYGAFRAATGALGRRSPGSFQLQTATATVGIRGTVFDVVCRGSCGAAVRTGRDAADLAQTAGAPGLPAGVRESLTNTVAGNAAGSGDRALFGAIARIVVGGLVSNIYVASGLARGDEAPDALRVASAATGEAAIGQATALAIDQLGARERLPAESLVILKEALDAALTSPEFRLRLADEIARAMTAPAANWNAAATEAAVMVSGAVAAAAGGSVALQQSVSACAAATCDPWRAQTAMQVWALLGATAARGGSDAFAVARASAQTTGQGLAANPGAPGGGLIVRTDSGATSVTSGGAATEVRAGQTVLIAARGGAPQSIDKPAGMPGDDAQRPEDLRIDLEQTFGAPVAGDRGAPGFYTSVNEGSIGVREGGGELVLAAGEASFSVPGGLPRRTLPPSFLVTDRFLAGSAGAGQVCLAR